MGVACADDSSFSLSRNISLWWSEETEYVLQRLERWAALARGYNRLRSARLSPGRMTMQAPSERERLNCCNLDYKSNGNLDSKCLEAYSLDHSIYFKTVGEVRSEAGQPGPPAKKNLPLDCGDFLSTDFDDDEDEEEEQREAARRQDELNGNLAFSNFRRRFTPSQ